MFTTTENITLEQVNSTQWFFNVTFDTTALVNGPATLRLEAYDVYNNGQQLNYLLIIENRDNDPPDLEIIGITNETTYAGIIAVMVEISNTSPLAEVSLSFNEQIFHSAQNLTVVNETTTFWTTSFMINTTILANGEYTLGIMVKDVNGNSEQVWFTFFIENEAMTTSTPSTTSPTDTTTVTTSSSITSMSIPPQASSGFQTIIAILGIISLVVLVKWQKTKRIL